MKSTKSDNRTFGREALWDSRQKPFDVNGLTLLLCTEGCAVLGLDFKPFPFSAGDVAIVPEGMSLIPHRFSSLFCVQGISIAPENIRQTEYKISSGSFWDYLFQHPVLRPSSEQYRLLVQGFEQMRWMIDTCHTEYRDELISSAALSFFIGLHSELHKQTPHFADAIWDNHALQLLSNFSTNLSRHHPKHRDVGYYANLLSITPDYLNKLCKIYWKVGAKSVINATVVMAIKNYLTCTDLSVKSIALKLNFDDPSYMCRLFRKSTGCSPVEFRTQTQRSKKEI